MKPLWKVRTTIISLSGMMIMGRDYRPIVVEEIYRWKWRARWAAFLTNSPFASFGGFCVMATVEPYWPDASNVVPLRAA